MARMLSIAVLVALALGIGALVTNEGASASAAFDLDCTPGPVVDGQGTVDCTLSVTDLPQQLPDVTIGLTASYADVDGSGDPSPGDRLKCISVTSADPPMPIVGRQFGPCSNPT